MQVIDCAQETFQQRVRPWMMECFGAEISADRKERNHRFFEESTELVQSTGMTASEAHQLVDYVYGRDIGEPAQEVGGVMVTLAALCLANDLDMHDAAEVELARIWTKVEAIRAKQAAKPKHSPLPQAATVQQDNGRDAPGRAALSAKVASYPDIPEGWQLVPKQPTPEMIGADFVKHPSDVFVNESVWRGMLAAAPGGVDAASTCWCHTCRPVTMLDSRMVLCPTCGNKRCPRANDHRQD